jgi:hypothetical protein
MSDDLKSLLRLKGWLIAINTVLLLVMLAIVFAWAIPARAQGIYMFNGRATPRVIVGAGGERRLPENSAGEARRTVRRMLLRQ